MRKRCLHRDKKCVIRPTNEVMSQAFSSFLEEYFFMSYPLSDSLNKDSRIFGISENSYKHTHTHRGSRVKIL